MDQLINSFAQIEMQYQQAMRQADHNQRYELVEKARELYSKASYCDRKTLLYAYPEWSLVLRPKLT